MSWEDSLLMMLTVMSFRSLREGGREGVLHVESPLHSARDSLLSQPSQPALFSSAMDNILTTWRVLMKSEAKPLTQSSHTIVLSKCVLQTACQLPFHFILTAPLLRLSYPVPVWQSSDVCALSVISLCDQPWPGTPLFSVHSALWKLVYLIKNIRTWGRYL